MKGLDKVKRFLNNFHIGKHHIQLYDYLNDRFCVPNYSYQGEGYWIDVDSDEAKRAFMLDDVFRLEKKDE